MSYPINNQRINPRLNPAIGNVPMQGLDTNSIKSGVNETVSDSPVTKAVDQKNSGLLLAIMAPTALGIIYAMNQFSKACGGAYDKSLVGKIGKTIDDFIYNHKTLASISQKLENWSANGKNFLYNKIAPKSKILNTFLNTPSIAELQTAKTMTVGTIAEIGSEAVSKLQECGTKGLINFEEIGTSLQEVEHLKETIHTKESISRVMELYEKLGNKTITEDAFKGVVAEEKKSVIGHFKDLFKFLKKDIVFSEDLNKMKALEGLGRKTWLGKTIPNLIIRSLEGLTNGNAGGKLGILMGSFIIADAIKKTIDAPKGHGEKRKTFAENLIYNEGWYLTMPIAMATMNHLGGLRYIGIDKTNLETYRKHLADFNKRVKNAEITDKAVYKQEKKALKELKKQLLKPVTDIAKTDKFATKTMKTLKNLAYVPIRAAARILTWGRELPAGFTPEKIVKSAKEHNLLGSIKESIVTNAKKALQILKYKKLRTFQGVAGGAIRFGVFMFAISPFFAKIFARGSHVIFGKPTHSVLDEGKEEDEKEKHAKNVVQPTASMPVNQTAMQVKPQEQAVQTLPVNQPVAQPQMVPSVQQVNRQVIPNAQDNYLPPRVVINPQVMQPSMMINNPDMTKTGPTAPKENMVPKAPEPVRTYIPSSEPVKVAPKQYENDTKAQSALNKANAAEQQAIRFIH